jgi:hypothetical protein
MVNLRRQLVQCEFTLEVIRRKDLIKEAGILQLKMITEIVLLLASDATSVSQLVQKVSNHLAILICLHLHVVLNFFRV